MSREGSHPICLQCKYFYRDADNLSCKAFPNGIPDSIVMDDFVHVIPYPGDNGILYSPLPELKILTIESGRGGILSKESSKAVEYSQPKKLILKSFEGHQGRKGKVGGSLPKRVGIMPAQATSYQIPPTGIEAYESLQQWLESIPVDEQEKVKFIRKAVMKYRHDGRKTVMKLLGDLEEAMRKRDAEKIGYIRRALSAAYHRYKEFPGHKGRPGKVGGSLPRGAVEVVSAKSAKDLEQELENLIAEKLSSDSPERFNIQEKIRALQDSLREAILYEYERANGRIESFGELPDGWRDGKDTKKFNPIDNYDKDPYKYNPTIFDDYWREARDTYVVDDDRTTRNNRKLRRGETLSGKWLNLADELCKLNYFDHPTALFRGMNIDMPTLDKMIKQGGFTDLGYMSTGRTIREALLYSGIRYNDLLEIPKGRKLLNSVNIGEEEEEIPRGSRAPQKVVLHLITPDDKNFTFGDVGYNEYVLPRGRTVKIIALRRPKKVSMGVKRDGDDYNSFWHIYGEVS